MVIFEVSTMCVIYHNILQFTRFYSGISNSLFSIIYRHDDSILFTRVGRLHIRIAFALGSCLFWFTWSHLIGSLIVSGANKLYDETLL